MNACTPSTVPEPAWNQVLGDLQRRTVMVIGAAGTGKTRLCQYLVSQLARHSGTAGLLSADMGQASVGVPTCLGLALSEPWDRPAALWFVGDVSPPGNLLPTVVGTARLVERGRDEGARAVIIDTTGLVDGPLGRVLKYHKALAAGVDRVVAIQRNSELEAILALLGGLGAGIHRLRPVCEAKDRSPQERKAFRQEHYREHFQGGDFFEFDPECLIGRDWAAGGFRGRAVPPPGTLAGLLDRAGFCLRLGTIEQFRPDRLLVYTAWKDPPSVARIQLGRVRLDRGADFAETR